MSKTRLADALKKLRELPENATDDEIEAAELDVYNAYETDTDAKLADLYEDAETAATSKTAEKFSDKTKQILDEIHEAKLQQERKKTRAGPH